MATSTTRKTASAPKTEAKPAEKPTVKKYKDEDLIPCLSITGGELLVVGEKSNSLYSWKSEGDIVDVEYRDLVSAIRSRKVYIYAPSFVIQDEEFLSQHKDLKDLYAKLYSKNDLSEILKLPPDSMKRCIEKLPDGAKESLKSMAMAAINDGSLDSVKKIKILDTLFKTDMMIRLAQ